VTLRVVLPGGAEVQGEPSELAAFLREFAGLPAQPAIVASFASALPVSSAAVAGAALEPPPVPRDARPKKKKAGRPLGALPPRSRLSPELIRDALDAYAGGTSVSAYAQAKGYENSTLLSGLVSDAIRALGGQRHKGAQHMDPRAVEAWSARSPSQRLDLALSILKGKGA
jgi:hypothetical protein